MALLRKRRSDPAAESIKAAFEPVATAVEAAQRALLAAIPTARDPGVPLGQALAAFGVRLEQAQTAAAGLPAAWRDRVGAPLAEARARAGSLRLVESALGFEALNARVGEVLHPLEDVADIEREVRRL